MANLVGVPGIGDLKVLGTYNWIEDCILYVHCNTGIYESTHTRRIMNHPSFRLHRSSFRWCGVVALSILTAVDVRIMPSAFTPRYYCQAWVTSTPVSQLLEQYSKQVNELKSVVQTLAASSNGQINMNELPYSNDAYYLRYCILPSENGKDNDDDTNDPKAKLLESLQWRQSARGQVVCSAARHAVLQATTTGTTTWTANNQQNVFLLAPHAAKISPFITPSNCITTSFDGSNDLIYCVRAGAINDVALFQSVTTEEMIDFFLYVKEIHALVCDVRSVTTDRLLYTITVNDLTNVKLMGGSNEFRKALSQASTLASTIIYPSTYTGPTLLCNLPLLVSALVQLFTPLFPEKVKQRLKFVQGPLSNVSDLTEISKTTSNPGKRAEFLQQLNNILQ